MTNPAWGTKRTCQNCACKYYDFGRSPIACPRCQAPFDPSGGQKLRSDPNYRPSGGRAKSVFGRTVSAAGEGAHADASPEEIESAGEPGIRDIEPGDEDVSELGDDEDELAEIDPSEEES